jgi:hypothetical protein
MISYLGIGFSRQAVVNYNGGLREGLPTADTTARR